MNIRRLMGRLYPGRNGSAELTQADISMALGFVSDKLAREVLCACWWEDGSIMSRPALLEMIGVKQYQEISRQRLRFEELAMSTLVEVDTVNAAGRNPGEDENVKRMTAGLNDARRALWFSKLDTPPTDFAMLGRIREAALREVQALNVCGDCGGRMFVWNGPRPIKCQHCNGVGTVPISNRERAAMIDRDESNYRRQWAPVYVFTHRLVRDAERDAVAKMQKALEQKCRGRLFPKGEYRSLAAAEVRH